MLDSKAMCDLIQRTSHFLGSPVRRLRKRGRIKSVGDGCMTSATVCVTSSGRARRWPLLQRQVPPPSFANTSPKATTPAGLRSAHFLEPISFSCFAQIPAQSLSPSAALLKAVMANGAHPLQGWVDAENNGESWEKLGQVAAVCVVA